MQSGRWFIEQIHRVASRTLRKLTSQLHTLCFTAGQCWCRLTKADVPETNINKRLHVSGNCGLIREEIESLRDRHVEYFSNVLALKRDVERVSVVTIALAHFARHIHIWQEMHFNLDCSVSRTGFATATLDVETETSGHVTANFCFGRCCKQFSNGIENTGVRSWVRAWRTTNGRLIHVDHFVDGIDAFNSAVTAWRFLALVDALHHGRKQDVSDKSALATSRYASDSNKTTKRNVYVDVLQVVFTGTTNRNDITRRRPALLGNFN